MNDLSREARRLLDAAGAPAPDPAARLRMKHAVLAAVVAPGAAAAAASAGAKPVGTLLSGLLGKVLAGTAAVAVGAGAAWSVTQVRRSSADQPRAAASHASAHHAAAGQSSPPTPGAEAEPTPAAAGREELRDVVPGVESAARPPTALGREAVPDAAPGVASAARTPEIAPRREGRDALRSALSQTPAVSHGHEGAAEDAAPRAVPHVAPAAPPAVAARTPSTASPGREGGAEDTAPRAAPEVASAATTPSTASPGHEGGAEDTASRAAPGGDELRGARVGDTAAAPRGDDPALQAAVAANAPGVREELAVLRLAKAQHDASQWRAALDTLDVYDTRFPAGALRTEAGVLRVLTLCALQRPADARALAARLLETEPGSPAVRRLAGTCAGR